MSARKISGQAYDFVIGERAELADLPQRVHPSWNGFFVVVLSWRQWGTPSFPGGIAEPTHVRLCAFGGNAHPHAWIPESMLRPKRAREKLSTWTKFRTATGIDIRDSPSA